MKRRDTEYTQVISHMFVINATEVLFVIFDLGRQGRTDTGEKTYACDICIKKKKTRQSKVARQRRIYTREKWYICEICNMRFSYRTYPAIHQYSHKGRKS